MTCFNSATNVFNIYGNLLILVLASLGTTKIILTPLRLQQQIGTSIQIPQQHEWADTVPALAPTVVTLTNQDITLGPCIWAIGRTCPDNDIEFYLYTRRNPDCRQRIIVHSNGTSNLSLSMFDKRAPTKIILHGYNADMLMHALQSIKNEYLAVGEYNIFYVEWSKLALGLCYLNAVHNLRHVGRCVAQLVNDIIAKENFDIHVIGFSLGAHLANYISRNLVTYRLPRITGLDPALPLFITSPNEDKLDASDADYVDVMHTNALVQGKFEQCGHSDVYMNGGIFQPNCVLENTINSFPCFHHRAIEYFIESIRSLKGFWAWPCSSYLSYILGMCPPTNNLVEIGANIKNSTQGMHFVDTYGKSPYAMGKWINSSKENAINSRTTTSVENTTKQSDALWHHIEQWRKFQ